MKVSDFKSGDIVVEKDGDISLVVEFDSELYLFGSGNYGPVRERIESPGIKQAYRPAYSRDVVRIFDHVCEDELNDEDNYTKVFPEEVTELTMDEIAKKFGVDVSTLKIKKD